MSKKDKMFMYVLSISIWAMILGEIRDSVLMQTFGAICLVSTFVSVYFDLEKKR